MVLVVARVTGVIYYLKIVTVSNEPTIGMGGNIFASNLKKPKPLDFIVFNTINPETNKPALWIFRLCAMGGDTVVIKDGILFVNRKNMDEGLNLNSQYMIPDSEAQALLRTDEAKYKNLIQASQNGVSYVELDMESIRKYKVHAERIICPAGTKYSIISSIDNLPVWEGCDSNWSVDQFGPIVVPRDAYFVLGDNRHNALDSRYRGFVNKSEWRATVL